MSSIAEAVIDTHDHDGRLLALELVDRADADLTQSAGREAAMDRADLFGR